MEGLELCVWKPIAYEVDVPNKDLERCKKECNGYDIKCQYYMTRTGKKYETKNQGRPMS